MIWLAQTLPLSTKSLQSLSHHVWLGNIEDFSQWTVMQQRLHFSVEVSIETEPYLNFHVSTDIETQVNTEIAVWLKWDLIFTQVIWAISFTINPCKVGLLYRKQI